MLQCQELPLRSTREEDQILIINYRQSALVTDGAPRHKFEEKESSDRGCDWPNTRMFDYVIFRRRGKKLSFWR